MDDSSKAAAPAASIVNALTVDVEDYFQVSALSPYIPRDEWDRRECRVEQNVNRILTILNDFGARGTFFTLGWVAERYPGIVREIVRQGHELASHGFIVAGIVHWPEALLVGLGALVGGYLGAHIGKKLPPILVKYATVFLAAAMTLHFFLRAYS